MFGTNYALIGIERTIFLRYNKTLAVTLPTLPSIPLPQIPLGLGEDIDTDRY